MARYIQAALLAKNSEAHNFSCVWSDQWSRSSSPRKEKRLDWKCGKEASQLRDCFMLLADRSDRSNNHWSSYMKSSMTLFHILCEAVITALFSLESRRAAAGRQIWSQEHFMCCNISHRNLIIAFCANSWRDLSLFNSGFTHRCYTVNYKMFLSIFKWLFQNVNSF